MAVLDGDTEADVKKLFIDEGLAVAGSKPQQLVISPDTKRLLAINSAGDGIEIGVSDDSKQVLIEGAQNILGLKTFKNGANVEGGLNSIDAATFQFGIFVLSGVANLSSGVLIGTSLDVDALADFNSIRMSKVLTAPAGGIDEGSAPDLDTSDFGEVVVSASGSNIFFNIDVAPAGKLLLIRNISVTDSAAIGSASNMIRGLAEFIPAITAKMFSSDGTDWWPIN